MDSQSHERGTQPVGSQTPLHRTNEGGSEFLPIERAEVNQAVAPLWECMKRAQIECERGTREFDEVVDGVKRVGGGLSRLAPAERASIIENLSRWAAKTGVSETKTEPLRRAHDHIQKLEAADLIGPGWGLGQKRIPRDSAWFDVSDWATTGIVFGAIPIVVVTLFLKFSWGFPFWLTLIFLWELWGVGLFCTTGTIRSSYRPTKSVSRIMTAA